MGRVGVVGKASEVLVKPLWEVARLEGEITEVAENPSSERGFADAHLGPSWVCRLLPLKPPDPELLLAVISRHGQPAANRYGIENLLRDVQEGPQGVTDVRYLVFRLAA